MENVSRQSRQRDRRRNIDGHVVSHTPQRKLNMYVHTLWSSNEVNWGDIQIQQLGW